MNKSIYDQLKAKGFIINPEAKEDYLKKFENANSRANNPNQKFWEDKRVLITGISGFAGSHMADKLLSLGAKIYGLARRQSVPEYPNIKHILDKVNIIEANLQDPPSVYQAIKKIEPEVIFHLGAQSFIPTSFRCPVETFDTNIIGSANIFEALRNSKHNIEAIHIAGSSEEYGLVYPEETPIKETNALRPQSPYAVSKVSMELMGKNYHEAYGMPVVITRAFNHTGPRRGLQFVTSVINRQILKIANGETNKVIIGNPDPIRDFTDVRDTVRAYLLAIEKAKKGTPYNIGHGMAISIKDLIKLAADTAGVKNYTMEIDQSRFRPADVEILVCDYSKAKEELGYEPQIPLTQTLKDGMDYLKTKPHLLNIEAH
ncbi:GDP-mannose 4,6-dehydratase [Candidatus Woesearchaeota archaeon]|nr:GDP-mannose 4,6-dehydratase [Candidatus Woesearchaeota archaeon]